MAHKLRRATRNTEHGTWNTTVPFHLKKSGVDRSFGHCSTHCHCLFVQEGWVDGTVWYMVYGIISSSSVQVKLSKCRSVCSSKYRNEILLIERRMHAFYFVVIVHSFSIEVVECRPLYVVSQRDGSLECSRGSCHLAMCKATGRSVQCVCV